MFQETMKGMRNLPLLDQIYINSDDKKRVELLDTHASLSIIHNILIDNDDSTFRDNAVKLSSSLLIEYLKFADINNKREVFQYLEGIKQLRLHKYIYTYGSHLNKQTIVNICKKHYDTLNKTYSLDKIEMEAFACILISTDDSYTTLIHDLLNNLRCVYKYVDWEKLLTKTVRAANKTMFVNIQELMKGIRFVKWHLVLTDINDSVYIHSPLLTEVVNHVIDTITNDDKQNEQCLVDICASDNLTEVKTFTECIKTKNNKHINQQTFFTKVIINACLNNRYDVVRYLAFIGINYDWTSIFNKVITETDEDANVYDVDYIIIKFLLVCGAKCDTKTLNDYYAHRLINDGFMVESNNVKELFP